MAVLANIQNSLLEDLYNFHCKVQWSFVVHCCYNCHVKSCGSLTPHLHTLPPHTAPSPPHTAPPPQTAPSPYTVPLAPPLLPSPPPTHTQEQVASYASNLVQGMVALLKNCPQEVAHLRKELLIAARHILATDLRNKFLPCIDHLFDESLLIGSGWTTRESVR